MGHLMNTRIEEILDLVIKEDSLLEVYFHWQFKRDISSLKNQLNIIQQFKLNPMILICIITELHPMALEMFDKAEAAILMQLN